MKLGMYFTFEEIRQICKWINVKYIVADLSTWIRDENINEIFCGKSIADIKKMSNDELDQWIFEYQTDLSMQHFFYNNIEYLIESFNDKIKKKCDIISEEEQSIEEYFFEILRGTSYVDNIALFFKLVELVHPFTQMKASALIEFSIKLERSKWEKDNIQKIIDAQLQLKQIQTEVLDEKSKLIDVRSRKAAIEVELQEKESLAEDVERRIADRITTAKQDAAQFISDMAFCSATVVSPQRNTSIFSDGIQAEIDQTIILENPDDLLDHMRYELSEAGVDDEYSLFMAAFLYSAYCNKIPLLLAGPNAGQIANAFAVCMTGSTAAAVDCNQDYSANWTEVLNAIHSEVVVIRNPFRHDWIHPIIEKLEMPDKFFLLLHPFAEDLCIEPAGLLNYVLPVLTEAFVSRKATGKYTASTFAEDFKHYEPQKLNDRLYSGTLKKLFPQALLRKNIQQLITDLRIILPEVTPDIEVQLGIIPSVYIMNNGEKLLAALEASEKDTKQSQRFLRAIMGKDE